MVYNVSNWCQGIEDQIVLDMSLLPNISLSVSPLAGLGLD